MTCSVCGSTILSDARFCSHCGHAVAQAPPPFGGPHSRLVRPREGRVIAGVCAGFAQGYGWDVSLVRLVLGLALLFGAGTPIFAYLVAWIVMPNAQYNLPPQVSVAPQ